MRAKKIELVEFKLDASRATEIEILMNDSIRFFRGKFCYNTSPYSDATLVDMQNIIVGDKYLEFDYQKRVKTYHSKIDIQSHEQAKTIAEFIKKVDVANNFVLANSNDKVVMQYDKSDNSFYFSIQNANESKWMNVTYSNKYGSHFTLVHPKPSKRYKLKRCSCDRDTIYIQTEGKNLWDDKDADIDVSFDWQICLQPDLLELIKNLLSTGIRLVNEPS